MSPLRVRYLAAVFTLLLASCGVNPVDTVATQKGVVTSPTNNPQAAMVCPTTFVAGAPSVVQIRDRIVTLLSGTDCQVYYTVQDANGQSGYALTTAGVTLGAPSGVSVHGSLYFFVIGSDRRLYYSRWTGSSFSAYSQLAATQFLESPAAFAYQPPGDALPQLWVLAKGMDAQVYVNKVSLSGTLLSTTLATGGQIFGSPASSGSIGIGYAVRGQDNQLYFTALDPNTATWHAYMPAFAGTTFTGTPGFAFTTNWWFTLLGADHHIYSGGYGATLAQTSTVSFSGSPGMSSTSSTMLMQAIGTDNQLYQSSFTATTGWSAWQVIVAGPVQASGTPPQLSARSTLMATTFTKLASYQPGCGSAANSTTPACQAAASSFCQANGYGGGYGPVEETGNSAAVICMAASTIQRNDSTFTALHQQLAICTGPGPYCDEIAAVNCQGNGGNNGFVTEVSGDYAGIMCSLSGSGALAMPDISVLTQYNAACTGDSTVAACRAAHNRYCVARGYATGYGIVQNSVVMGSCLYGL